MNPLLVVLLMLVVSAFVASAMNLTWTAALLFSGLGFLIWMGMGSVTRRYYKSRNNVDELSRQDIPAMLWLLSMGSVGFGLHDAGQDAHPSDMGGGWSGGDAGSIGDGGGFGGGSE